MVLEWFRRETLVVSVVGEKGARNVVVVAIELVCDGVMRGVGLELVCPLDSGWVPLNACVRRLIVGLR